MGRTSNWLQYQDRRRRKPRALKKSRSRVYARRYYWVMKLRRLGVPEIDIPDTVAKIMESRAAQAFNEANPDAGHRYWHSWYARNRSYVNKANKARYEKRKAEEQARRNFLLRAAN